MIRRLALVAGTALIVSFCPELDAQHAISERCGTVSLPQQDSQPIPEQLKIPTAPKTSRQVTCFRSFDHTSAMADVVQKCGMPDLHIGSGIYMFVYYMNDCSVVIVRTGDLQHLEITHIKRAKPRVLLKY
jgi:hypothetical protein